MVQNITDSPHYRRFPKRNGTGKHQFPICAACQNGLGIGFFLRQAVTVNHAFIAGKLNVLANHKVGNPHQRIKPENRQNQIGYGLPPVILAAKVALLMGNHIFPAYPGKAGRQVDFGPDDSLDKGGRNGITNPDVLLLPRRFPDQAAQLDITKSQVTQHQQNPKEPHQGNYRNRLTAAGRSPANSFLWGHDSCMERHRFRVNEAGIHRLLNGRGGLRDEIHGAFQGNRQKHPHRNHGPKNADHPPGSLFQQEAKQEHGKNQPIRPNTDTKNIRKGRNHIYPSPA